MMVMVVVITMVVRGESFRLYHVVKAYRRAWRFGFTNFKYRQ
jgi:hypothetical protein